MSEAQVTPDEQVVAAVLWAPADNWRTGADRRTAYALRRARTLGLVERRYTTAHPNLAAWRRTAAGDRLLALVGHVLQAVL